MNLKCKICYNIRNRSLGKTIKLRHFLGNLKKMLGDVSDIRRENVSNFRNTNYHDLHNLGVKLKLLESTVGAVLPTVVHCIRQWMGPTP